MGIPSILSGELGMKNLIFNIILFLTEHEAGIALLGLLGWAALALSYPFDNLQPVYAN